MTRASWVTGGRTGLEIPADATALHVGGKDFLTRAFRKFGVIGTDNSVSRITEFESFAGGGTGSKLLLAVAYEKPVDGLEQQLFVKFSRNFDDPIRDSVRYMLKPEIQFASVSRQYGFPIVVPECYFADFDNVSGTGILITQRIPYNQDGTEPHYIKCMDHLLPDPADHYKAIMKALARLAAAHKTGRLAEDAYRDFPFDFNQAIAEDTLRYRDDKLQRRLSRLAEFTGKYPTLMPAHIASRKFHAGFAADVARFVAIESDIRRYLFANPDFIALCHWNANIDNAWFWQNDSAELECGLMDWGAVAQMSVAKSIYGSISGANTDLWDEHLDAIIDTFITEFVRCGGPRLDALELKKHVRLFTALMGVAYLLDAPAIIENNVPDLNSISGPQDERLSDVEDARVQLHMLTMFLHQWKAGNIGELITEFEAAV